LAKKKAGSQPLADRKLWVTPHKSLALARQCELAGVARSTVYAPPLVREPDALTLLLLAAIDAEYTRHPFFGSRRMVVFLIGLGHFINRKRIQRLMGILGLAGMAPGPNTSRPHPEHKIYPYLLRGLAVVRPNQVWSTDITYIRLERGFVYLAAVIDWYSRKVLTWRLSNTLDSSFCVVCLEEALQKYGTPEIFNTDQGCQFTSEAFTSVLIAQDVKISMDGRGRALDNIFVERLWRSVKHEDVYLNGYDTMPEVQLGLTKYFMFYNTERTHQSLDYSTPDAIYRTASGGGARIVDKFKERKNSQGELETGAAPFRCGLVGYHLNLDPLLS